MFNIFSKSKKSGTGIADFPSLKADMHSHLLPGIDDGAPDLETSLRLIRGMSELGYTKLITTPHVMGDMYRNTSAVINEKLEVVREALQQNNINVELNAAAEYFLDDYLEQILRNNEPLLPISGNLVLVEFSLAYPSHSLKDILFTLQMQGYVPVIAHPERYIYLENSRDFYDELKDLGCHFQLNILSLTNHYGKSVHELANYLIKKGYYNLVGTDLHHSRHLEALHSPGLVSPLKKLIDSGQLKNAEL